ncbi:MAG: hypothetical protein ACM3PY_21690 [Omnitrophica WOR_2 bacterium]
MWILEPEWTSPDSLPPLKLGDVHVWLFTGFSLDQSLFAHNLLRSVLAGYLHTPAQDLRFFTNPIGRQFLLLGPGQMNLCFSMDYSNNLTLVAVTIYKRIGIAIKEDLDPSGYRQNSPIFQGSTYTGNYTQVQTLKRAFMKAHGELDALQPEELDMSQITSGDKLEGSKFNNDQTGHRGDGGSGKSSKGLAGLVQKNLLSSRSGKQAFRPMDAIAFWKDPIEYKSWHLLSFRPVRDYIAGMAIEADASQFFFVRGDQLEDHRPQ